jgi:hypothetical protein
MPRRGRLARPILLIAMWLLIGVALNVGVTWMLAASDRQQVPMSGTRVPPPRSWPIAGVSHWPAPQLRRVQRTWSARFESISASEYIQNSGMASSIGDSTRMVLYIDHGWPCLSMGLSGNSNARADDYFEWHDCWQVRSRSSPVRLLPLQILRVGFAFNSMFYAGVAWLLFRGPFVLKHARRWATGRCLACGYDRQGLAEQAPCPECGQPPLSPR